MTQQFICLVLNNTLNCDTADSLSSVAENSGLVGCTVVSLGERYLTLQRFVLPPSSDQAAGSSAMLGISHPMT